MKKQRITYAVYNIIEWHALISMGKAVVKVTFSGGAITTSGVTPATFTTSDPVVQFAIERCAAFKSGKIKKLRSYTLDEDVVIERNAPKPAAPSVAKAMEPQAANAEAPTEAENAPASEEGIAEAAGEESTSEESNLIDKEFDNNEDAKSFLADNYAVVKSKMRTRADIVSFGKSVGVNIIFV